MPAGDIEECIHGIVPVLSCTHCNGTTERERQRARTVVRHLPARFETVCPECREAIWIGSEIVELGDGRYVHQECAPCSPHVPRPGRCPTTGDR